MITLRDKYMLGNKHILFLMCKYFTKGRLSMENVKEKYFYLCMNGICANREYVKSEDINIDILYKTCHVCGDMMLLCENDELEYEDDEKEER